MWEGLVGALLQGAKRASQKAGICVHLDYTAVAPLAHIRYENTPNIQEQGITVGSVMVWMLQATVGICGKSLAAQWPNVYAYH